MEIEEDFLEIYSFRRVTVFMDCIKPLRRFQNIRVKGGSTVKIHIKYERLPHFCVLRGMLDHTKKDCSYVTEEEKEKGYGWGMDIRAFLRCLSKNKEEIDALKVRKNLFITKPIIKSGPAAHVCYGEVISTRANDSR